MNGTARQSYPIKPVALFVASITSLAFSPISHAAIEYVQIPSDQPWDTISTVGSVPVLPFELAPQAAIADLTTVDTIPGVPNPVTGSLAIAPSVEKYTLGTSWNSTWINGFTGSVYFSQNQTQRTLSLPPRTTAFHVFVSPNNYTTANVTALSDTGATSGAIPVANPGQNAPTPGIGFYSNITGEFINSIVITADASASGFGMGLFGIAQAPAAPALSGATASVGSISLAFTAPAETGSHPVTSYLASCVPQSGGAAISASSSNSPVAVSGLAASSIYECTVAARSDAGTGPVSNALSATVPAAVVAAPTPVPTLGSFGLAMMALFTAGFGIVSLRRKNS